jgi:hypothetical protein
MAKLDGAQRTILQAIQDSPKYAAGFVSDSRIARSTRMAITDVRDWIVTLEGEGVVEVAMTTKGLRASITAEGRLILSVIRSLVIQGQPGIQIERDDSLDTVVNDSSEVASTTPFSHVADISTNFKRIVLAGPPSCGKTSLANRITNRRDRAIGGHRSFIDVYAGCWRLSTGTEQTANGPRPSVSA